MALLTAVFGAHSVCPPDARAGLVELDAADRTPMLLYQRADRALYRAKSEGRDRTAIG